MGDNIFYGYDLANRLNTVSMVRDCCTIVACNVKNPELYGIVEIDRNNQIISIEEKPLNQNQVLL